MTVEKNDKVQKIITQFRKKGYEVKNYESQAHIWEFHIPQFNEDLTDNQDWHGFRKNFIGSSEVGCMMGLNDWRSPMALYHHKVGSIPSTFQGNESTESGRAHEDMIALLWEYYGGDDKHWFRYNRRGEKVRKCEEANYYLVNEKYPQISVSIDRKIPKGTPVLFNVGPYSMGDALPNAGPLEEKTSNFFAAKQFACGLPLNYYSQVQSQLLVMEADYGEYAMLVGGKTLEVIPIVLNEGFVVRMYQESQAFWAKIIEGRKMFQWYLDTGDEQLRTYVDSFEPSPDGTKATKEFLMARQKGFPEEEKVLVKGEPIDYTLAKEYKFWNEMIRLCNDKKTKLSNKLRAKYADSSHVSLGGKSKITFDKNAKIGVVVEKEDMENFREWSESDINKIILNRKLLK